MKIEIGNYFPGSADSRKTSIEISPHDTYSLDTTLAVVIWKSVEKLKKLNKGYWRINVEDVDIELDDVLESGHSIKGTEWILDEIIWTFKNYYERKYNYEHPISKDEYIRIQRGLNLFAKYYGDLWW